jgi:hypothetical protein
MAFVKQLLQKDRKEELVTKLKAASNAPPPQINNAIARSMPAALALLYKSCAGADFDIILQPARGDGEGGQDAPVIFKCHSFVLQSRWPYFETMASLGMKEAVEAKLTLPPFGRDGGMHPVAMEAILDMIYLGQLRRSSKAKLLAHPEVAVSLVAVSDLYLFPPDGVDANSDENIFQPLLALAVDSVTPENCLITLRAALSFNCTRMIEKAKDVIVENAKTLADDPNFETDICELPKSEIANVLTRVMSNLPDKPKSAN